MVPPSCVLVCGMRCIEYGRRIEKTSHLWTTRRLTFHRFPWGAGRAKLPVIRLSISGGADRSLDGSGRARTAEPIPGGAERFGVDRRTKPKAIEEAHNTRTNSYLHFSSTTEEAFNFYKAAFGTEFVAPIVRMGDLPVQPGQPELSADEKNLVMNVQLPITGGHLLVGNDAPGWMGTVNHGNALDIGIDLDTRAEADSIYAALAEGGTIDHALGDIYSGEYFGSVTISSAPPG